jgi:hypothetical protein
MHMSGSFNSFADSEVSAPHAILPWEVRFGECSEFSKTGSKAIGPDWQQSLQRDFLARSSMKGAVQPFSWLDFMFLGPDAGNRCFISLIMWLL